MNAATDGDLSQSGNEAGQPESGDFTAPLGAVTSGRLVFPSGAAGVTLRADPALPELYRAHFERHVPRVQVRAGTITLRYRHFPLLDWLVYAMREPLADLTLHGAIPWELEFHAGVSRLTGDLGRLQLRSLDILGGASQVTLALAERAGTGFLHIAGGASDVAIHCPAGVAVRLQVGQGASQLVFDDQRFGALGGETCLETPGYGSARSRYDIRISGGAHHLRVGREPDLLSGR